MKVDIVKIIDRGIKDKERLWLKVNSDCDLVYFTVHNTVRTSETTISNNPKNVYWFKSKKVKAGDSIILYTRKGTPSINENENKSNNHFLFWGLDNPLWNEEDDCAVLFEINSWQTSPKE